MEIKQHEIPYYIAIRKGTIKNKSLSVGKEMEKWKILYTVGGNVKMVQPLTRENSMSVPQKFKKELPHVPAVPLLVIHQKELKAGSQKGICTCVFITALFTTAKR